MKTQADRIQENKSQSVSNGKSELRSGGKSTFQFVDNRLEAVAQRKLQEIANNSTHAIQLRAFRNMANNTPQANKIAKFQATADNHTAERQKPIQKKENNTGLLDNLKTGVENLSGISLDDVKVHRNSDKPAQLQAHAYAQGTDIHLGAGQEKHLPHEAWHVVQQKQGRVKPTLQMKGGVLVNDETGLEKEADVMGQKAQSVGMISETRNDISTAQRMEKEVIQGKFTLGTSPQFSKTRPIQLSDEGKAAAKINNVTEEQIESVKKVRDQPLDKIKEFTGLTAAQIATAQARLFGETEVQEMPGKVDGVRPEGPNLKPRAATTWDKLFMDNLTEESIREVEARKIVIPTPTEIFGGEAGIQKHLDKFKDGAHAFITPKLSDRILGTANDWNFAGWGADYNFITPLSEADEVHKKAEEKKGIVTLEEELGIIPFSWSKTKENPNKEMVRWTIPKPQEFELDGKKLLSVATGNETGAYVKEWVAGGYTLGGATEAVIKAIPRFKLLFLLASEKIKQKTVVYSNTPDDIG